MNIIKSDFDELKFNNRSVIELLIEKLNIDPNNDCLVLIRKFLKIFNYENKY